MPDILGAILQHSLHSATCLRISDITSGASQTAPQQAPRNRCQGILQPARAAGALGLISIYASGRSRLASYRLTLPRNPALPSLASLPQRHISLAERRHRRRHRLSPSARPGMASLRYSVLSSISSILHFHLFRVVSSVCGFRVLAAHWGRSICILILTVSD
jgi:hypothetical protein